MIKGEECVCVCVVYLFDLLQPEQTQNSLGNAVCGETVADFRAQCFRAQWLASLCRNVPLDRVPRGTITCWPD